MERLGVLKAWTIGQARTVRGEKKNKNNKIKKTTERENVVGAVGVVRADPHCGWCWAAVCRESCHAVVVTEAKEERVEA